MNRDAWQRRNVTDAARTWLDRDAAAYLRQSGSTPCITAIRRAEGAWLEDYAGKRYIDLHGNSVHHIGYGHPRLIAALTKQLQELPFTPRRFTDEPAVILAEMLTKHWPGGRGKVLLTTGGSDAIEVAMKIARVATGHYKTISFYDSYHGSGFGALSVGGRYNDRSPRLGPLLEGALHVPPYYRRGGGDEPVDSRRWAEISLDAMRFTFEHERQFAAVIAEPIRSAPHIPPDWYWPEVRKLCDQHGALLIFDEIPTGLGKTGKFYSSEHVGARPDITVLGKALGGGVVPVAAVIARADLDCAPELALGHYTHEKNPFTARAALTTLEIIRDDNLTERAARLGERVLAHMENIARRQKLVRSFRVQGCLFAIELHADANVGRSDSTPRESVAWRALEKGVNLSAGDGGDLSMTAPLMIDEADLDLALELVEEAIAEEWAGVGAKGE